MPSEKRSHGRITSGNVRPHKTARFGHELGNEDLLSSDDSDNDMVLDARPFITTAPNYKGLDERLPTAYTNMRVAEVVAWPTSLATIRNHIQYNLTPQEGVRLPDHVLHLVSGRILRPSSRDGMGSIPQSPPYVHLGFTPFLNMQIFIFLPNLRQSCLLDENPASIPESVLENWTDTVILPAIARNDPRAPTSWRLANLYRHSPAWYHEEVAPFPVYKMYDSQEGRFFAGVWEQISGLSMKTREYQHPFLLLYSDGQCPQAFVGSRPEEIMRDFEEAWHKHIDMTYVPWPEDNLKVDFDYGNQNVRDLPMR